ncbi:MAG: hypothetical protein M3313_17345 [Actinomycetota bacterium]|nr:hypothetical protein [Actinomycetota bacterium]
MLRATSLAPLIALSPGYAHAAPQRPALIPATTARSAFDCYGINTHFSFLSNSVWVNTDAAVQWLQRLGVGAVRQALPRSPHGREAVKSAMDRLGSAGIRWCCPVLVSSDAGSLDSARAAVNFQLDWLQANTDLALLDSLPGLNEPNSEGKAIPDWVARTRVAAQALWEETRRRPAFDGVLIQGSPLNMKGGPNAVRPDVEALGDLTPWIDRGDAHLYPGEQDPGLLATERLAVLDPIHGGKPLCVSEGGYTTSIGRGYTGGAELVPEDVAGLYAPKHLMVHLLAGRKFFSYELLDEAPPYTDTDTATREAGFGFIATPKLDPLTWRAKPGFEAMRRMLGLVSDGSFTPVGLRVQMTAAGSTLRSALLHRSDRKHLLAIWQAVQLYDWDRTKLSGRYIGVNPLSVTVTLDAALPVAVYEPSRQDTPVKTFTAQTFTQTLGAGMQVLQIG